VTTWWLVHSDRLWAGRSGDGILVGARFFAHPDRPSGPPSLPHNGYRVFPGGKVRPGRAADHSPPSSAAVMEEYSYTSTHPLGHTGPVTGSLYLYLFISCICISEDCPSQFLSTLIYMHIKQERSDGFLWNFVFEDCTKNCQDLWI